MEHHNKTIVASESIPQSLAVQVEVVNPPDDWSGTKSAAERRRRQNRINQRTWRQRHRPGQTTGPNRVPGRASAGPHEDVPSQRARQNETTERVSTNSRGGTLMQGYLLLPTAERRAEAQHFASVAQSDYSRGNPRPEYFPALVRLNVLDAMARNATALGISMQGLCRDELISPFNEHGPISQRSSEISAACPATLLPTEIQKSIIHHPWIDLIPIPQLRDNVLLAVAADMFDEDELCADLLSMDGRGENASLIVWADSWDPRGWEASVAFLRKWGWLLTGCHELCRATNNWRGRRGEKQLTF